MKLIELVVITGGLFAVIVGGAIALTGACTPGQIQEMSENNARIYAKKMGIEYKGLNCSTTDSDSDGYVSCDLNTTNGIVRIECALWGSGCKPKLNIQAGGR